MEKAEVKEADILSILILWQMIRIWLEKLIEKELKEIKKIKTMYMLGDQWWNGNGKLRRCKKALENPR